MFTRNGKEICCCLTSSTFRCAKSFKKVSFLELVELVRFDTLEGVRTSWRIEINGWNPKMYKNVGLEEFPLQLDDFWVP